jgi:chorismate mutase/prephenate dehydratase
VPAIERVAVNSNAEAARRSVNEVNTAAIAGQMAAEIYQLSALASCIEDQVDNTTRFAVLGQQEVPPTGYDKTSLLLSSPNRPGALYRLLESFATHAINMTRIESRPSRQGIWEYVFFIDIEGHIQDSPIASVMQTLETHASLIKQLGSYPRAVL